MSPAAVVLTGQTVVGQSVTTAWFDGTWEITQGWGPSDYSGEPEGHGYGHWHAGVDVGLDSGTTIHLPHGLECVARWIDNPRGYGIALRLELYTWVPAGKGLTRVRKWDVWLGHLRQRLVSDGQTVLGGRPLAVSNNTGNSLGPHLHFEVRPAGGRYGTDVDPSSLLLVADTDLSTSSAGSDGNPYNPLDPRYGFWELEHQVSAGINSAEQAFVNVAQAGLGASLLIGGLAVVAFGLRGKSMGQLRSSVTSTVTRASRARSSATDQEQRRLTRAAAAEEAGIRRNTERGYRAGLVSQAEAQRRLGYPVRRVGNRAAQRAAKPPRGIGHRVIRDTETPALRARRSRIRPSHQRDFMPSPDLGDGGAPF